MYVIFAICEVCEQDLTAKRANEFPDEIDRTCNDRDRSENEQKGKYHAAADSKAENAKPNETAHGHLAEYFSDRFFRWP